MDNGKGATADYNDGNDRRCNLADPPLDPVVVYVPCLRRDDFLFQGAAVGGFCFG